MSRRYARINCYGLIHDDDSKDWFGGHEEESFSWSPVFTLKDGGFSRTWTQSHTVDDEVQLRVKLRLRSDEKGVISVSGHLELREGGGWWTLEDSHAIGTVLIEPNATESVFEGRLEGDGGDWADVTLEIMNAPID